MLSSNGLLDKASATLEQVAAFATLQKNSKQIVLNVLVYFTFYSSLLDDGTSSYVLT